MHAAGLLQTLASSSARPPRACSPVWVLGWGLGTSGRELARWRGAVEPPDGPPLG